MAKLSNSRPVHMLAGLLLGVVALSFLPQPLYAQHGHPLVGTWSGFMNRGSGQPIRTLFTFDFNADQVISGALLANGRRFTFDSATLDPDSWTVTLNAQGEDRVGNTLNYFIVGAIENLDSPTVRTLVGTWQEGGNSGDFQVVIN